MLYVTTRSNRDAYTAQRILRESRGEDGGLYIPFRSPQFSQIDIDGLGDKSFHACVADVLNLQFHTKLTFRDVELAVGRYSVRLEKLHQRIVVAECWHNPKWTFSGMISDLARQICGDDLAVDGTWLAIGVRIAILCGIYGELKRAGLADRDNPFDVSSVSGDFSTPVSAWYARKWGLPIGNIVCCCNENNDIWNLFCHGLLRTDGVAIHTLTPDADIVIPDNLERLISAIGGPEETARYLNCVRTGATYYTEDAFLQELRCGMYVAVVSQPRMRATIRNVFGTSGYILSPYDSLAYAGLLDYRSRKGESRCALLISEKAPSLELETVASAMDITPKQLKSHIDRQ